MDMSAIKGVLKDIDSIVIEIMNVDPSQGKHSFKLRSYQT